MGFVVALLAAVAGFLMIIKTDDVIGFFGRVGWAERHLGSGGSISFYKLLGVLLIVLAMLWVTGLLDNLLLAPFGVLFGGFKG